MFERLQFQLRRLAERLWVRPLIMVFTSVALVFLAQTADGTELGSVVPEVTAQSVTTLLQIMASSMLVIATFSVASMVSAYSSASNTATPRAFALVVSDDTSQNALSAFIGAFIFSVVALVAVENSYYGPAGRFALFCVTLAFFAFIVFTFVRWVDRIARLGRLAPTIDKVEAAAAEALARRRRRPRMGGMPLAGSLTEMPHAVFSPNVGYVQRVDLAELQAFAAKSERRIAVAALPGTFALPDRPLALVSGPPLDDAARARVAAAFTVDGRRTFDEDPRFGLVVLSEIASRALSPAVNDPGTAIDVIGTVVRLLTPWWNDPGPKDNDGGEDEVSFDRVAVPELSPDDLLDDAFMAIARDGAGTVEVAVRLQKAFGSLAAVAGPRLRAVATRHARSAQARATAALSFPADQKRVRHAGDLAASDRV